MKATTKYMVNKVCMITGASAGIGEATALSLAKLGASVVIVCRDKNKGLETQNKIIRRSGNNSVKLLLCDLSSQASIRKLVTNFKAEFSALHVLINSAATIPQVRTVTEDGIETQMAVNHLAYFLITNLLLDILITSQPARIINVTSIAHAFASLNLEDLESEKCYTPRDAYAQTKLANVLFTYELARRLQKTKITVNCVHPGVIGTNLLNDYIGRKSLYRIFTKLRHSTPKKGAKPIVFLATSPDMEGISGKYYSQLKPTISSGKSYDETMASQLWDIAAKLTNCTVPTSRSVRLSI